MVLPVGSRFRPTDLGLVRSYLRNMVEKKQSSFITTMDVYKDEPWLLHHVTNPLFDKKVWYYFVPRSKRGGQTPRRTVPGRGGSEGGFWKSTGKKEKILDGQKRLMGFKQCLTYYQKSQHVKDGALNTDWLMTEYTLDKGREFQDLVLCHIREKKATKDKKLGFVNHVPQPQVVETRETNNIVSNQLVPEEADFADELEAMMLQAEDGDDTQQKQQQQEEEIPILPQVQSNDNNGVVMAYPELREHEAMLLQGEDRDDTQQQQQQQQEEEKIQILPLLPPNFAEDYMFFDIDQVDQGKDVTKQQQEEEKRLGFMNEDDKNLYSTIFDEE